MTVEEKNKEIIARYIDEAWRKGNLAALDEFVAEDAVFHDLVRQGKPAGRAAVRASMAEFRTGFPDMDMQVFDMIAEGDLVSFRWRSEGTHLGDLQGVPPSGRSGALDGIVMVRLRDGIIVEGWQEIDLMGMLQRLRILPSGGMPRPMVKAMYAAQNLGDRLRNRR